MSTNGAAEKVRDFYQLIVTDTQAAIERYVAEDIVWDNPLPENIPFGGCYEGIEGLVQYLTQLASEIEMSPLNITEIIVDENKAAVVGIERDTRVIRTGKTYTMPFVHVLKFNQEGKINHVHEYNVTGEMVKAFSN